MADYSDSDDDMGYSKTSVLLGYAEDFDSKTTSEDMISHLGGIPTWLDESSPMDSRLAKCLNCKNVMPLLLQLDGNIKETPYHSRLLYIFGCRSKTCRRKAGSIRAVRGVKVIGELPDAAAAAARASSSSAPKEPEKTDEPAKPARNIGNMIFGAPSSGGSGNVNPFAGNAASSSSNPFAISSSASNPFMIKRLDPQSDNKDASLTSLSETFAAAASIKDELPPSSAAPTKNSVGGGGPPTPWPDPPTIPSFPSLYLDASYEELDPESDELTKQAQELARIAKVEEDGDEEMDDDDDTSRKTKNKKKGSGGKKADGGLEDTESPSQKAFNHFSYIASQNPEQVLRYERNGTPLLYSVADEVGKLLSAPSGGGSIGFGKVPRCKNCGEKRVYEVQLMPHAISALEEAAEVDMLADGMEWGTVIVATCSSDCTLPGAQKDGGGYTEEWAGVQWE